MRCCVFRMAIALIAVAIVDCLLFVLLGDVSSSAAGFVAVCLLTAVVAQFISARLPEQSVGTFGGDGKQAFVPRASAIMLTVAVAFVVWTIVARPEAQAFWRSCGMVLTTLLLLLIEGVWRKLPHGSAYARPGEPLAICGIALILGVVAQVAVIAAIGPAFGVLMWAVPAVLAAVAVALLVVRERYMAAKARRMESGRSLPLGIDAPKRPLGARVLVGLSAVPMLLALLGLASLPWGLRAITECENVDSWTAEKLGGHWAVTDLFQVEGSYLFDYECELVYAVQSEEGERRAVSVRFPGMPEIEIGEEARHPSLVDLYWGAASCEAAYLAGFDQPVITGFCDMPNEVEIEAPVLWQR